MSASNPPQTDTASAAKAVQINPEMEAYYSNRPLMWRNLGLILFLNLGWSVAFTVVNPLIQLRLNSSGVAEHGLGLMGAVNNWIFCYAVMYFAWKSDHTVSRFGRRIPYLFISAPAIILAMVFFPLSACKWLLIGLAMIKLIFMDIKAATIPLLNIDCMPRQMLARTAAPAAIMTGLFGFFSLRYGMRLSEWSEVLPFFVAALILTTTTLTGGFLIKEPPVKDPTTEKFRPWSAMKVALKDRRALVLMVSVALFQTFHNTYQIWVWLYAKNVLNLSRVETGHIMSWGIVASVVLAFPCAWLVDRISPYKLLPVYCGIAGVALWFLLHVDSHADLTIVAGLVALLTALYPASDIMVYRKAHPAIIGSVTATNSCLRGFYIGCTSLGSGWLIQKTGGHYDYAFAGAFALTLLGLVPLFFYRHLMQGPAIAGESAPETVMESAPPKTALA